MMEFVQWLESHQGTAAWAQTVGTLIALAVAIGFPIVQQRALAKKEQRATRARLVQQVGFILAGSLVVKEQMSQARAYLARTQARLNHKPYNEHEVTDALQSLNGFPLHDFPTTELVIDAVQLRGICQMLVATMDEQLDMSITRGLNSQSLNFEPYENVYSWFEARFHKWEAMHLELIDGLHR